MKKTTKALLLTMCAIALVAASIMGTLAYLTDTKTVTNTFTVGAVAITLDEAKVDVNGNVLTGEGAGRWSDGNSYKLMPGHTYTKDPVVHVAANSEDCWLFVKVENNISAIEDSENTILAQMNANGWTRVNGETNVYAYSTTQSANADVNVFGSFKIAGNIENDALAEYTDKTIVITAYAIQADGFTTAAEAWAASGFGTTTTD